MRGNGPKRRLKAETFPSSQIGGDDDVLNFVVCQSINVVVTREPASYSFVSIFDAAFLPAREDRAPFRRAARGSGSRQPT